MQHMYRKRETETGSVVVQEWKNFHTFHCAIVVVFVEFLLVARLFYSYPVFRI